MSDSSSPLSRVAVMPFGPVKIRKSSTSSRPSAPGSAPVVASLLLDKLAPDHDAVDALINDAESYVGEEQITIYNIPSILRTSIDRIRAQVLAHTSNTIGVSTTLCYCLTMGVKLLASYQGVKDLIQEKKRLDLAEFTNGQDMEMLYQWFRSFNVSVPDFNGSVIKKQNIALTDHSKRAACQLASNLGCPASSLVVFASMLILSEQPSVHPDHKASMRHAVAIFQSQVEMRVDVSRVLLDRAARAQTSPSAWK